MQSTIQRHVFVPTRDGRQLHAVVQGSGSPTVIFESGMGGSRNCWASVAGAVADRTTAVVYDRSGLGRSRPDDAPRDLARLADDLLDVVHHFGDDPVVLVAHSWGGPIARVATAREPERIAGLVLVDQTDEGCDLYFSAGANRRQQLMTRLLPVMARTGLLRAAVTRSLQGLPPDALANAAAEDATLAAAATLHAEIANMPDDMRRLRDDPLRVPTMPTSVISGTKASRWDARSRTALVAAHRRRAAALPRGRHVEASRSGHMVMVSEPEVIVAEIARTIDDVAELAQRLDAS